MLAVAARQALRSHQAVPCQEALAALLARGLSGSAPSFKQDEDPAQHQQQHGTIDFGELLGVKATAAAAACRRCCLLPLPPATIASIPCARLVIDLRHMGFASSLCGLLYTLFPISSHPCDG